MLIQERHPLFPQSQTETLDLDQFHQPSARYRGAPFWAWNNRLDLAQLLRQMRTFHQMGMGGFHIHARTGLATPYLSDEFMTIVRECVDAAKAQDLYVWLYDEDRWPSGAAGGLVTQDPSLRARHLLLTTRPYSGHSVAPQFTSLVRGQRNENGTLVARYQVVLHQGLLASYRRLAADEPLPANGTIWYAYAETAIPSPWFNNQTYVDTLNPAAIAAFIATTHERYRGAVGDAFGRTIPAIFTDEPQFTHKIGLRYADDTTDVILPFTDDLFETYAAAYHERLEDALPEVIWNLPNGRAPLPRYRFHDHICERFTSASVDQLGAWCSAHDLLLTGHMMEEPTLQSQTAALGEAMRAYRSFHLPGIDMLCDRQELNTAKQAQSAARQYGRPGVASELYGVTNWDFDFVGHKAQGDWQAALGVTVRVPHLTWVSMAGEAKRDYPASIGYQSPWYQRYALIEDHFARLNTVLTRGKPVVHVGVIHPIESYWLCFGPQDQSAAEQSERETAFTQLTEWLLFGQIDFDFIAESLLPDLCPAPASAPLTVGECAYTVVIVPSLRTIRSTTLERLEAFHAAGGLLIFAGEVPSLVDAVPSDRAHQLAAKAQRTSFTQRAILDAVEEVREIGITTASGARATTVLTQIRSDGPTRYAFLCQTDRQHDLPDMRVQFVGTWHVTQLDTSSGAVYRLPCTQRNGMTTVVTSLPAHGSLMVCLAPTPSTAPYLPAPRKWREHTRLNDPVPVRLAEPNVLLLDRATYRLDEGEWQPEDDILRLDNHLRTALGFPLRYEAVAQPWTHPADIPTDHRLHLCFSFSSEIALVNAELALEQVMVSTLALDGHPVEVAVRRWYVDEAIGRVPLPPIEPGRHVLELTMPYGPLTDVEACYLLGDFGVRAYGRHASVIPPVRTLAFGDWTRQGLPFYGGNVTYQATLKVPELAHFALHISHFAAPLLDLAVDGQPPAPLAFAPYTCEVGLLAIGAHTVDITTYGNRVNTFGSLHHPPKHPAWYGPNIWRTEGDEWTDEYQLRPQGILSAPHVLISE
ncbi:MAG: hypothetical protein C5B60_08590 [Chloroflexi bacterium]|nr:MAG: hypothetical protein C5B60_08590 [Chloroflexota bacterium]